MGNSFFAKGPAVPDGIISYTGPRYPGPVIVLTDAETYSCGDTFASSVKDNGVGLIVGIHNTTGGGGSIVYAASFLRRLLPIPILPGVKMSTSVFRVDRVRNQSGVPIEYFGVKPNVVYKPTRRDRLEKDADFYEFLGNRLTQLR